jgi:Toprim-like
VNGSDAALELVRFAGLRPASVRRDRVALRCPFHADKRPSAAVLSSGVLVCSAGCGSRSPYSWLVELGGEPAAVMELLVRLELRADRSERRSTDFAAVAKPRDAESRFPGRPGAPATNSLPVTASAREPATELAGDVLERLAVAVYERRRLDERLGELRGFSRDVLDRAGVGIGRAAGYGFAGPRAALREPRLLVPSKDERGRTVGLLAIAPNPERRAEPKLLALAGAPRVLLELAAIPEPVARMLLVCEGELDALAAASAGVPAAGVPGIGGFERFAGRIAELVLEHGLERALLVPDADGAGRASFRELAAAIAAAGAPAVYADVLERGKDVGSELVRLAGELELELPELDAAGRRRAAGRALLALALTRNRRRFTK